MRPQTIGRALGIGVRIAGRAAGQRLAGGTSSGQASSGQASSGLGQPTARPQTNRGAPDATSRDASRSASPAASRAAGRAAALTGRGVARGAGGFLRPFRRVGGIVWLEVTGVFFLLPVVVFAPKLWQTRASWEHGPGHRMFVSSAIVVAVFLYLGVTSFWRAHRRSAN